MIGYRKELLFSLVAVLLASCSAEQQSYPAAAPPSEAVSVSAGRVASYEADTATPQPSPQQPQSANGGVMLAYSYAMAIEAPKANVAPLAEAHAQACIAAGPSVCQVLGSSVNAYGDDQVSAYLNLRAEPVWLAGFRTKIAADSERAGGEVTANTVSTEDLTQYIIDVTARLEAKKTLRERITLLLETREGGLNDVLAAERALSEVQGEIDSMTASLEAARARIAMSALNISYSSDPETSVSVWKPVTESAKNFGRRSLQSLAGALDFVASSWPFFLLGLIVLAILRAWWRGRKRKA